jgi:hypothetical protein
MTLRATARVCARLMRIFFWFMVSVAATTTATVSHPLRGPVHSLSYSAPSAVNSAPCSAEAAGQLARARHLRHGRRRNKAADLDVRRPAASSASIKLPALRQVEVTGLALQPVPRSHLVDDDRLRTHATAPSRSVAICRADLRVAQQVTEHAGVLPEQRRRRKSSLHRCATA